MRETDNLWQYSIILILLLAMGEPSKRACISDMMIERELYIYSEQEISTDDEYDNLPCHSRPSVILKTAEMRRKRSLKVAHGRPEATEMHVLGRYSHN
jgi:hypothetical protein